MTTIQTIKQLEKELKNGLEHLMLAKHETRNERIIGLFRNSIRTLLESFGEELLDVDIKKDKEGNVETEITFACNLRADQRLKAKEIISSLEK